jgi:hypothetical protein
MKRKEIPIEKLYDELKMQGMTIEDCAKENKCSANHIHKELKRHGVGTASRLRKIIFMKG